MVVDASVWVSAFVIADVHHAASRALLHQHLSAGGLVIVPTLALTEVAGAIARWTGASSLGRQAATEILRTPLLRLIPLDREAGETAASTAANLQLRGADAVYVAAARTLGIALVTWDEEIIRRAGSYISILHP